jgi:hypothetical protein
MTKETYEIRAMQMFAGRLRIDDLVEFTENLNFYSTDKSEFCLA